LGALVSLPFIAINAYYSTDKWYLVEVPLRNLDSKSIEAQVTCRFSQPGWYIVSVFVPSSDFEAMLAAHKSTTESAPDDSIYIDVEVELDGTRQERPLGDIERLDFDDKYLSNHGVSAEYSQPRVNVVPFPWTNNLHDGALFPIFRYIKIEKPGQFCTVAVRVYRKEGRLPPATKPWSLRIERYLDAV